MSTKPEAAKVALVTGSARGIGEAIAIRLAKDGYAVAVSDLPFQTEMGEAVAAKIKASGGRAIFIPLDVTDREAVFKAVRETSDKLGGFGLIVNNAGIAPVDSVLDTTEETMDKLYAINVKGVLWGMQAAAQEFLRNGTKGRILSLASIAGREGFVQLGAYCATKHSVKALTQSAARELGKEGILVNCIGPGVVSTPMWKAIDADLGRLNNKKIGESKAEFGGSIVLGRFQEPEDVANLASFFGSPDSSYVTGQLYIVDGGMRFD